jgi:hypothetical protein
VSNPNQPVSGTEVTLVSTSVAALVGDLTPGPHTTSADLHKALLAATEAVVSGFRQQITAPAQQPVSLPTNPAVTQAITSTADAVIQRQVVPQIVARRTSATVVSPNPISAADDTVGRAVQASHGPFLDIAFDPNYAAQLGFTHLMGGRENGRQCRPSPRRAHATRRHGLLSTLSTPERQITVNPNCNRMVGTDRRVCSAGR